MGRSPLDQIEIVGKKGHRTNLAEEVGNPVRAALVDKHPVTSE